MELILQVNTRQVSVDALLPSSGKASSYFCLLLHYSTTLLQELLKYTNVNFRAQHTF